MCSLFDLDLKSLFGPYMMFGLKIRSFDEVILTFDTRLLLFCAYFLPSLSDPGL